MQQGASKKKKEEKKERNNKKIETKTIMNILARTYAIVPNNQWIQLNIGRFLAVGLHRQAAIKG